MPTVTEKRIKKSAYTLERLLEQAKRTLFELETLANAREIQRGNVEEFRSGKELLKRVKGKM